MTKLYRVMLDVEVDKIPRIAIVEFPIVKSTEKNFVLDRGGSKKHLKQEEKGLIKRGLDNHTHLSLETWVEEHEIDATVERIKVRSREILEERLGMIQKMVILANGEMCDINRINVLDIQ